MTFHQAGNLVEAERLYQSILSVAPDDFDALHFLGLLEAQRGRYEEASRLIRQALKTNPRSAGASLNYGNILAALDRNDEAVTSYEWALSIKPDFAEAFYNRGNALQKLRRYQEAIASYQNALAIVPQYADALNSLGNTLQYLHRFEEAIIAYERTLSIEPAHVDALNNRGVALAALGDYAQALASVDKALAIDPTHLRALVQRGSVLQYLKREEEALVSYGQALAINPGHVELLNKRGVALRALKRYAEALSSYDRALAIVPGHFAALNNRGNVLQDLGRHEEALASYDKALANTPGSPDALNNRGNSLQELQRYDEAIASYAAVLSLQPDYEYVRGMIVSSKLYSCDSHDLPEELGRLVTDVRAGKRSVTPFVFLGVADSASDQLRCAQIWASERCAASPTPVWRGERYRHDKIRVAYLSADLRDHPVSSLLAGLFERHDRTRFETIALSFGPDDRSEMSARLKVAFERFVDVRAKSDREIARLLRELEVDIAVDLMGFTRNSRPGVFAYRAVPVQVNYLGYPGTMGTDCIDYILADRVVIPDEQQVHYAEKIVYLPDSFQANDSGRRIAQRTPTREEVGLPDRGFVFCSFNNNYKIMPVLFNVWMRLLSKIEGSVLWLKHSNAAAADNLRNAAAARGVDGNRLVFAPQIPLLEDHLARHRLADIFLDTLPYNAHTTASDALWAGVPVLTCMGTTYAGRVAASLLNAVGIPELITCNLEAYEALALKLATTPAALSEIRNKLAGNRSTHPLFDTERFRRHIEAAYMTMWDRYQRGAPPASFAVVPISSAN